MDNETKAWIVIAITTLISVANDIFNFLPVKADHPDGWNNLYFIVMGFTVAYLLVKSAVKEALKEHNFGK